MNKGWVDVALFTNIPEYFFYFELKIDVYTFSWCVKQRRLSQIYECHVHSDIMVCKSIRKNGKNAFVFIFRNICK